MATIIFQAAGAALFVLGTIILGKWIRTSPTQHTAAQSGIISHLLFHVFLFSPLWLGIFYPRLDQFDRLVGVPQLPWQTGTTLLGVAALVLATLLIVFSTRILGLLGKGAPSFLLTQRIVAAGFYARSRNPIALGWYLLCLGISLVGTSTYLLLLTAFVLIPAHIFYLKYFEEVELTIRFGDEYVQYAKSVPFLIPRLRRLAQQPQIHGPHQH